MNLEIPIATKFRYECPIHDPRLPLCTIPDVFFCRFMDGPTSSSETDESESSSLILMFCGAQLLQLLSVASMPTFVVSWLPSVSKHAGIEKLPFKHLLILISRNKIVISNVIFIRFHQENNYYSIPFSISSVSVDSITILVSSASLVPLVAILSCQIFHWKSSLWINII